MLSCMRSIMRALQTAPLILAGMIVFGSQLAGAATLDEVRQRGVLNCGVSEGLEGFSAQDASKEWRGFDVDYCRAVAAAVLGDAAKVAFVGLDATARFEALTKKKIDVLARNTTWTLSRDVAMEFEFVGVSYYDGQGFMTRRANGLSSALQLSQATICVLAGTTSETNAVRFFADKQIPVKTEPFQDRAALAQAYDGKKCDAYSADLSGLASIRLRLKQPDDHMLLPEVISKEPLGPVVRQGDPQWIDITRWTLFLLVNAEEVGWTKTEAAKPGSADVIVVPAEVSKKLALAQDWPRKVIQSVGNYGEVFARNVGEDSPLGLSRGVNALWTRGGILYAPPMR
jgi:general L-amino acid transport system substrate-binding protein